MNLFAHVLVAAVDGGFQQRIVERMKDTLDEMHQRVEDLKGEHSIPATELFSPDFMREHTKFGTLDAFFGASGFEVGEEQNFEEVVSEDALDPNVQETISFDR